MNNVKLLIAGSAFFAMSAQAADRVDWPPESPDNQYHLNK